MALGSKQLCVVLVVGIIVATPFVFQSEFVHQRGMWGPNVTVKDRPTLAASELPGYTGWARPASTLAGGFRIKHMDAATSVANQDWTVIVTCDSCPHGSETATRFYARAYGPAIINGKIEQGDTNDVRIKFYPIVSGHYTVEVVLTYSDAIDPNKFPLTREQLPPPYYEGYLLPGFPIPLFISDVTTVHHEKPPCTAEQITLTSSSDQVWKQAGWSVVATNKHDSIETRSFVDSRNVTLRGYQWGQNSLGFRATYEFNDCTLAEILDLRAECHGRIPLHVIFIGDSVMRVQKDYFSEHLDSEKVQVSFFELYGGALRCARQTGPNISSIQVPESEAQSTIVVWNTGMHDIHRLCGHSFMDERPEYLTPEELELPCTTNYLTAVRDLASAVHKIPATVRIFQTTTAAWPKYGNYGFAWDPRYAQELPLDSSFVERFNQIALEEIYHFDKHVAHAGRFTVVDAYWITLARPDNRESSKNIDIGKKLSHPGLEVIDAMVRIWWQAAMHELCTT